MTATTPNAPLPRNAARLLAVMFPSEDVCQRSLEAIAAEGFSRNSLPATLRRLVEAGFLSRHRGSARCPTPIACTCRAGAAMRSRRREKVFGPGRAVPLDRNAKARIAAYARAWSARNRQPGQHKGPITRAFLEVLEALLWGFHNSRSGVLLPELRGDRRQGRVLPRHGLRGAEGAGVGRRADLAEPHHPRRGAPARSVRPLVEPLDGHPHLQRLRVPGPESRSSPAVFAAKSENPTGTPNQEIPRYLRPVLRERIESPIHRRYGPRRGCQPRQAVAGAESHHDLRPERQIERKEGAHEQGRRGRPWPNGQSVR